MVLQENIVPGSAVLSSCGLPPLKYAMKEESEILPFQLKIRILT